MKQDTMILTKEQMKPLVKQFRKLNKEGWCDLNEEGKFGRGHWIKVTKEGRAIFTSMVNNTKQQLYITRADKGLLQEN